MADDIGRLAYVVTVDNQMLKLSAEESQRILKGIGNSAVQEGDRMDKAFGKVRNAVVGAFGAYEAINFGKQMVKVRGEIESLSVSFATLLGDKAKGERLFSEIRKYATATPMGLQDLAKGAQTLLSFNVAADDVMRTLKAIGDISMGDSQKFQSLTLAFSQMSSVGKLMGQDLLQMINAGFNPLQVMAEKTGKSMSTLKEEMGQGAISAEQVTQAFMSATSEGGKFYGMLEAQSHTIKGALSNLQGEWEDFLNEIGEKAQPIMLGAVDVASSLIKNYEKIGKVLVDLIAVYGGYRVALMLATVASSGWTVSQYAGYKALVLLEKAQKALNATMLKNPWVLVATIAASAAVAIWRFAKEAKEANKMQTQLNETLKEGAKEADAEGVKVDILFNRLRRAKKGTEEYEKAKKAILDQYGGYLDGLGKEIESLRDVEGAYNAVRTAAINAAKARALDKAQTEIADNYVEKLGEIKDKMFTLIRGKYSNKVIAEGFVDELKNAFDKNISAPDMQRIFGNVIKKFDEQKLAVVGANRDGTPKWDYVSNNNLRDAFAEFIGLQNNYNKSLEKTKELIGEIEIEPKKVEDKPKVEGGDPTKDKYDPTKDKEARQKYWRSLEDEERQAAFATKQAEIDGMQDGFAKQMKQIKLNYDRMIAENERREAEMVERLRDKAEAENAIATKGKGKFDRGSVTKDNLPAESLNVLKSYQKIAEDIRKDSEKKLLDELLTEFATFDHRRLKVAEEFAAKRKAMYKDDGTFKEGFSEENVRVLNEKEQETYDNMDSEMAAKSEGWEYWLNEISKMSLDKLIEAIEMAEAELKTLDKDGKGGGDFAAILRAKLKQLKKTKEKVEHDNDGTKQAEENWKELYQTLQDCQREFEEIGRTIGGVAGEIISAAGQIAGSTIQIVSGIQKLVSSSIAGTEAAAKGAAVSISTVEKASVILTIISAVIQIAMKVAELLNTDDDKQEKIDSMLNRIEQLQWEIDNSDIVRLEEQVFSAKQKTLEIIQQQQAAMIELMNTSKDAAMLLDIALSGITGLYLPQEQLTEGVKRLAQAYKEAGYTADKALGSERFTQAQKDLEKMAEQQILMAQAIATEQSKKKPDQSKIGDWEREMAERGKAMAEILNEQLEEVLGGTVFDIAKELGDAFIDAFQKGENAAEAWGDKVQEIVSDIMRRLIIQKFLEEEIGDIFDRYKDKWFNNDLTGAEQMNLMIGDMGQFGDDLNEVGERFQQVWDSLPEDVKDMLAGVGEAGREASKKGIAQASQDSIDELNGRMTAIQGHTYTINENTKLLVDNSNSILASVVRIEQHTDQMNRRMSNMEGDLSSMRGVITDIGLRGVGVR